MAAFEQAWLDGLGAERAGAPRAAAGAGRAAPRGLGRPRRPGVDAARPGDGTNSPDRPVRRATTASTVALLAGLASSVGLAIAVIAVRRRCGGPDGRPWPPRRRSPPAVQSRSGDVDATPGFTLPADTSPEAPPAAPGAASRRRHRHAEPPPRSRAAATTAPPEPPAAMSALVRRARAIPTWQVTLGFALLALGFLIAAQLAAQGPRVRYTTQERTPLVETAIELQRQHDLLRDQITALRGEIASLEVQGQGTTELVRELNHQLEEARIAAGLIPLTGTGLVLQLERLDAARPGRRRRGRLPGHGPRHPDRRRRAVARRRRGDRRQRRARHRVDRRPRHRPHDPRQLGVPLAAVPGLGDRTDRPPRAARPVRGLARLHPGPPRDVRARRRVRRAGRGRRARVRRQPDAPRVARGPVREPAGRHEPVAARPAEPAARRGRRVPARPARRRPAPLPDGRRPARDACRPRT